MAGCAKGRAGAPNHAEAVAASFMVDRRDSNLPEAARVPPRPAFCIGASSVMNWFLRQLINIITHARRGHTLVSDAPGGLGKQRGPTTIARRTRWST